MLVMLEVTDVVERVRALMYARAAMPMVNRSAPTVSIGQSRLSNNQEDALRVLAPVTQVLRQFHAGTGLCFR